MGGVWERQIRTARKILAAIIRNQVLDDERLETFFCEAESIINGRPLTVVSGDPNDLEALTPNHLLLLRGVSSVMTRDAVNEDQYGKRWRHVQFIADQFWKRWVNEYMKTLQLRQKWIPRQRNFMLDDVVLVANEVTPRKCWPLGRVVRLNKGNDGLIRSVEVKTQFSLLVRPVTKLCLLEGV